MLSSRRVDATRAALCEAGRPDLAECVEERGYRVSHLPVADRVLVAKAICVVGTPAIYICRICETALDIDEVADHVRVCP